MVIAAGVTEAMSPGGLVRVRVGSDGRTLWVGLLPAAMRLSAAELANNIVYVNALAYMMLQVSQKLRTQDDLAVYARFVATRCRAGRRQRPACVVSGVEDALQPPGQGYDGLCRQVLARVKRIEALLAGAPANVEWIGGEDDVMVAADPAGRLAGLWLSPRCTTHYSAVELEGLLNCVLAAAGATAHPGLNSLRDAG
jgi:hypothetical protein